MSTNRQIAERYVRLEVEYTRNNFNSDIAGLQEAWTAVEDATPFDPYAELAVEKVTRKIYDVAWGPYSDIEPGIKRLTAQLTKILNGAF